MDSLIELRKLQHNKYLEEKAKKDAEENERLEQEKKEQERLEQERIEQEIKEHERIRNINEYCDNLTQKLLQNIEDLYNAKDYIEVNMIIACIFHRIKEQINFIKENNKVSIFQSIFFDVINTMNNNNCLSFNLNIISRGEKKSIDVVQKHIYNIMDILDIDRSILEINSMDTSNDEEYARKLQYNDNFNNNFYI